ncbi:MAG: glycosyltransferase family 4 protein [Bacteriovorax sp.]|nr:glycosyltransferase family 4 protein [Bacteriovorax sp.]
MKKTLYVSPNGYIGGAEKILIQIASLHFQNESHVHTLFFNYGLASQQLASKKIPHFILKNSFRLSSPIRLLKALREIRKIIKNEKIELIHSTMAYGHLVMSLASFGMNIKRVWFQHGPVNGILDKFASLFPVDAIFFNSEYLLLLHNSSNKLQFPARKEIIPLGIEKPAHLNPVKSSLLRFALIGRLSPLKGFDRVIKALIQLKDKDSLILNKIKLNIIGETNYPHEKIYADKLKILATKLGAVVEFIPFQNEMSVIYNSNDILVQSSLYGEGFGLVLAEAMSYGLLAVGPSYGGGTQILTNKKTGLSFDFAKSSIDELEIFMCDLINNFKTYSDIRENGRKLIAEKYTNEIMIVKILKIYEQL